MDDEPEVAGEAGLGGDSAEDRRAAKKGFFPSSMGLSFLVSESVETLEVLVRRGDYRRVKAEIDDPNRSRGEEAGEAVEMGSPAGVLHAKAMVADEASVFITSANPTAAAQDHNIELGLLVHNRALAATTVIHFRTLIERDLLRRLPSAWRADVCDIGTASVRIA